MTIENMTAKVTLLSDLHIGSGTTLLRDLDWIARPDGFTYIADPNALMESVLTRALADGKGERSVIKAITGLTLADLADAGRVECRRAGDLSAAEGGAEGGQGNVQRLPGRARGKAGLVVDAVEGIVGQQVQLEALASGAGLDEAGLRVGFASVGGR